MKKDPPDRVRLRGEVAAQDCHTSSDPTVWEERQNIGADRPPIRKTWEPATLSAKITFPGGRGDLLRGGFAGKDTSTLRIKEENGEKKLYFDATGSGASELVTAGSESKA
jgi:hypothetical protein